MNLLSKKIRKSRNFIILLNSIIFVKKLLKEICKKNHKQIFNLQLKNSVSDYIWNFYCFYILNFLFYKLIFYFLKIRKYQKYL